VNDRTFWADLTGVHFEQRWIEADGISTRALISGNADRTPLVFLHGIGGHAEAYIRNLDAHGEHFRTYAIDMVGHGFTSKPPLAYSVDDYVQHLRSFLDAEGISTVSLSGESMGGWVAARFTTTYPDRVDRLVLNTSGGYTLNEEVMKRIRDLTLAAVRTASYETVKARLEWLMADPSRVTPELVNVRLAIYRQPDFPDTIDRILSLEDLETRRRQLLTDDELQSITQPTLVLWTSQDPTAAVNIGQKMASNIPDSRFEVMDDCGHWPQYERPDEFNRIHLGFLCSS